VTAPHLERQPELAAQSASDTQAPALDRAESNLTRARHRVTLIISSLRAGGAERVLSRMANYWAERGWPVTMVTLEPTSSDFYSLHPAVERVGLGVSGVSTSIWRAVRNNLHRIRMLRRAIRASRPEVVIAFMAPTTVDTLLAARTEHVPVIVSERTDPVRAPLSGIWSALRHLTYPWAQAVVVQTPDVERWAGDFLRKDVVHVIPNPVSTSSFRATPSLDGANFVSETDDGRHHVVAMGRLETVKGFDLLLQAFAACRDRRPDWTLTILGEGTERHQLEALAKQLGVESHVRLPGTVADPTPILRRADLFVLSSRYEGFPNALLEAMALGRAVIATDCASGPGRIVRDDVDGVVVPTGDRNALADAMAALMDDEPRRVRLGEHAVDVTERFEVRRIMERWETVIEDTLEHSASPVRKLST
jgi:glycosyltransferase involved in cell wall biosynthesis